MFIFIGIMFVGVGLGYLLRKVNVFQSLNSLILLTVCVLLFVMGLGVGANELIVNSLLTLGTQALLLAFGATLGSVLAAWAVYHFFFKQKRTR